MNQPQQQVSKRNRNPNNVPDGILLIDKVEDMTSHDVVAIARRQLWYRKIGHCGTLDPMATGLIILLLGKATKLQDQLMGDSKIYQGGLTLGATTHSQDRTGDIVEEKAYDHLTTKEIEDAFAGYSGKFEQIPPMVSAIKINGVRLYKLARKGQEVERKPRKVEVLNYQIKSIELPKVEFEVHCTKGFYVRTYAHDIGQDLGCGSHLHSLRRTASGLFSLDTHADKVLSAETLKTTTVDQLIADYIIPLDEVKSLLGIVDEPKIDS